MQRHAHESLEVVLDRLGRRIAELRRARGLTQQQVADRVGMLLRDYQSIEAGRRNCTIGTLLQVAQDGLGEPVRVLLDAPVGMEPRQRGRPRGEQAAEAREQSSPKGGRKKPARQ